MDLLDEVSDRCIRRALGFAGLGVGLVLLALSFDPALAFRSAGDLVALVAAAMLLLAWRAPRRDMRRSEAWTMLRHLAPEWAESHPRPDLQARMRAAWRQRLIWHAERIAVLALLFWAIGLGIGLISA
jgi:hypothetical protein